MIKAEISTIEEELEKSRVKGFIRTRKGKLEKVKEFERKGTVSEIARASEAKTRRAENAGFDKLSKEEPKKTFGEIGQEILKELELVNTPRGFGGFGLDYIQSWNELDISYDTPREIRHEDEYFDSRRERSPAHEKALSEWNRLDAQVDAIREKFKEKYPGVKIETGGGVSGKDVVHIRHARSSEFVMKAEISTIDEEFEKARAKGAKDKQKRKKRLTTGKDWGSLPKARAMTSNEKKFWAERGKQKESAFIPKKSSGSLTQSSQRWLDRNRDYLD